MLILWTDTVAEISYAGNNSTAGGHTHVYSYIICSWAVDARTTGHKADNDSGRVLSHYIAIKQDLVPGNRRRDSRGRRARPTSGQRDLHNKWICFQQQQPYIALMLASRSSIHSGAFHPASLWRFHIVVDSRVIVDVLVNASYQAWTGHCAIVPWHISPLPRTQAPPGPFKIFGRA